MQITPVAWEPRLVNAEGRPMGEGRSKDGLHLSQIIRELLIATGRPLELPPQEQPFTRMITGFMWERALERAFIEWYQLSRGSMLIQPEVKQDGIYMTTDGVDLGERIVVEEAKATWYSARGWPGWDLKDPLNYDPKVMDEKFWGWQVQVMSHVRFYGGNTARIIPYFVNGAYFRKGEQPRGPVVLPVEFTYTPDEIEENWRMVLNMAESMRRRGITHE